MSSATLQPPAAPTPLKVPAPSVAEQVARPLWPITVALFSNMVKSNLLGEKDPVYLWKGQLVERIAPNRPHSIAVKRVYDALAKLVPKETHVEQEQPIAFRRSASVPQPDVAILRGAAEDYPEDFPTTADVLLVVEVADTSVRIDRHMAEDYAAEGVPFYWIINIPNGCIEVHSDPREGTYASKQTFPAETEIPLIIDAAERARIAVKELLP